MQCPYQDDSRGYCYRKGFEFPAYWWLTLHVRTNHYQRCFSGWRQ